MIDIQLVRRITLLVVLKLSNSIIYTSNNFILQLKRRQTINHAMELVVKTEMKLLSIPQSNFLL